MGWKRRTGIAALVMGTALALYAGLVAWGPGIEVEGKPVQPAEPAAHTSGALPALEAQRDRPLPAQGRREDGSLKSDRHPCAGRGPSTLCDSDSTSTDCVPSPDLYGPWARSAVAFEHFDSGRTHTFGCATFGGSMSGGNRVVARLLPGTFVTPYNWITDPQGNGYVYGGAYGDFRGAPGSFVASVGTDGSERWRRQLFDAPARPDLWNYPGVIGLHANGSLYAVFGTQLARLDPTTGAVTGALDLPAPDRANTAYNGFNGFADGRLVMKTVNRAKDCELQGFSAFLRCDGAMEVGRSTIAVVDPDTMKLLASVEAPEHIGGRLTTTRWQGKDRLYLAGVQSMLRYVWDGETLAPDPEWGPVPFMREGQTPAPAAAVMGEWILAQTNALPASEPMSLVAISQRDGRLVRIEPFASLPLWAAPPPVRSFLPAMLTVDPANSRVYVMDSAMGLAAAYAFDQKKGTFTLLWRKWQRTLNFSTLVGPPDKRVFVATDIGRFCPLLQCLRGYTHEQVVFRDAATGAEIARSDPLPKMTSGALVTPVEGGHFRYLGLAGEVYDLRVGPRSKP